MPLTYRTRRPALPSPDDLRAPTDEQPEEEKPWWRDFLTIPTALRVGGNVGGSVLGGAIGGVLGAAGGTAAIPVPVAGTVAGAAAGVTAGSMAGGALGAGLGDYLAEKLEVARGARPKVNPWQVGMQTALGAVPLKMGSVASGLVRGAAFGGVADTGSQWAETGELHLPSLRSLEVGAAMGAAGGAIEGRLRPRLPGEPGGGGGPEMAAKVTKARELSAQLERHVSPWELDTAQSELRNKAFDRIRESSQNERFRQPSLPVEGALDVSIPAPVTAGAATSSLGIPPAPLADTQRTPPPDAWAPTRGRFLQGGPNPPAIEQNIRSTEFPPTEVPAPADVRTPPPDAWAPTRGRLLQGGPNPPAIEPNVRNTWDFPPTDPRATIATDWRRPEVNPSLTRPLTPSGLDPNPAAIFAPEPPRYTRPPGPWDTNPRAPELVVPPRDRIISAALELSRDPEAVRGADAIQERLRNPQPLPPILENLTSAEVESMDPNKLREMIAAREAQRQPPPAPSEPTPQPSTPPPPPKGPPVRFGKFDLLTDDELEAMLDGKNADNRAGAIAEIKRRYATPPVEESAAGARKVARGDYAQQPPAAEPTTRPLSPDRPVRLQPSAPDSTGLSMVDPRAVKVDPKTYQFKGGGDKFGVTERLQKVEQWDPLAGSASPVVLHERANGDLFVVDGHQRVGLAKKLMDQGREVPNLRAIVLKEADGVTTAQARRVGAMLNLQQGTGSGVDVAKVLRESALTSGERARIPKDQTSGAKLRAGEDLSKLSDEAFADVVNGQVHPTPAKNEQYGAVVGRLMEKGPDQVAALRELAKAAPDNVYEAEQFIKAQQAAGFERGTQENLFGTQEVSNSLASPIAKVMTAARRVLGSDKSALANAIRNETRLTEKGNVLDTAANKAGLEQASALDTLLDKYGHTAGPVRDALKESAGAVQRGELTPAAASQRVLTALESELRNLRNPPAVGADAGGVVGAGGEGVRPGGGAPPRNVPEPQAPPVAPPTPVAKFWGYEPGPEGTPLAKFTIDTESGPTQVPLSELAARGYEPPPGEIPPPPAAEGRRLNGDEIRAKMMAERAAATKAEPAPAPPVSRIEHLKDIAARHAVENPKKVDEIAASMGRVGWKGRPMLVLQDGEKNLAWTAVHRLEAAKKAGLNAADVPMVMIDGAKLREAGFTNLEQLSQLGKKKRIAALRTAGMEEQAKLLENETAQAQATRSKAPAPGVPEAIPTNVRDYLVRQLKYTPDQVAAMSSEEARRIGRERIPPPAADATPAEAQQILTDMKAVTSQDAPPIAEVPYALERDKPAQSPKPQQTSLVEEEPPAPGRRGSGSSPRELGATKRTAEKVDQLFDEGKHEEAQKLLNDQIQNRLDAAFRHGVGKKPPGDDGGSMASFLGLGDMERIARKHPELAVRAVMGTAGATAGAALDPEHKFRGAVVGGLVGFHALPLMRAIANVELRSSEGVPNVRVARAKKGDIGFLELVGGSPERTIPEQFNAVRGPYLKFQKALRDEYERTGRQIPTERVRSIRNSIVGPALKEIRKHADTATKAGEKWKGAYIRAFADHLSGGLTHGQRKVSMLSKGMLKPDAIERAVGGNTYRLLTGWGLDTAIQNTTQPALALAHVPARDMFSAFRSLRTAAGKQLVDEALLPLERPTDVIERTLGPFAEKAKKLPDSQILLRKTDNFNRRWVYLGARQYAERQGLTAAAADTWAQQVMRKTQGEPGALGTNPFHRGPVGGSLRPFMKYPSVFTEHIADVIKSASHGENLKGAVRLGTTIGASVLLGNALGVDMQDLLISGGRPLGLDIKHPEKSAKDIASGEPFVAVRALKDVAAHGAGTATHDLYSFAGVHEFLGSDLGSLIVPRYPRKLLNAMTAPRTPEGDTVALGPGGKMTDVTTGRETLLNLAGLRSTRQTERRAALDEFYEEATSAKNQYNAQRRRGYDDLSRAIQNGDVDGVRRAAASIGNPEAVRAFLKRRTQLPEERFNRTLPLALRRRLAGKFKEVRDTAPQPEP